MRQRILNQPIPANKSHNNHPPFILFQQIHNSKAVPASYADVEGFWPFAMDMRVVGELDQVVAEFATKVLLVGFAPALPGIAHFVGELTFRLGREDDAIGRHKVSVLLLVQFVVDSIQHLIEITGKLALASLLDAFGDLFVEPG